MFEIIGLVAIYLAVTMGCVLIINAYADRSAQRRALRERRHRRSFTKSQEGV